jgi:hypothetical protein
MRGRVVAGAAAIAAARDHLAVAHNDGAEREIGPLPFLERHAHEALVICALGA